MLILKATFTEWKHPTAAATHWMLNCLFVARLLLFFTRTHICRSVLVKRCSLFSLLLIFTYQKLCLLCEFLHCSVLFTMKKFLLLFFNLGGCLLNLFFSFLFFWIQSVALMRTLVC